MIVEQFADLVVNTIKSALSSRDVAIRDLQQRVGALDGGRTSAAAPAKPRLRFRGDWTSARQYEPDDLVRHKGRAWRSKAHQISMEPGSAYGSWE